MITKADIERVKANLVAKGTTAKAWADQHGYDHETVYKILQGTRKCNYGKSHEIAVALGLKPNPETIQ
ncbi:DNA-binding protein [Acinetobacter sp. VNH17]|uniref:DNA-binding protein n=1 Tax=Acinetobacter thutiue TaxID=2998078 RepID=A0ABT7WN06_9GAMM|nr:DNA-binding protein [Acinetobacter thutiue]MCY6411967.1 DNA-binding protein [Acinetobacter thutiue]MDN0014071.1 DNA-binding protein [Acinetobacter thutiue]